MPPLSPVAWATFITGMDPGGHGIFDFVHRDPTTLQPQSSISRALPPKWQLTMGDWYFRYPKVKSSNNGTARLFGRFWKSMGSPLRSFVCQSTFLPFLRPESHCREWEHPTFWEPPEHFRFIPLILRPMPRICPAAECSLYRSKTIASAPNWWAQTIRSVANLPQRSCYRVASGRETTCYRF